MDAEQLADDTTWHWLWAHTARQIITTLEVPVNFEPVQISHGWGARSRASQTIILLHPSVGDRQIGDLSLTISGQLTRAIPRDGRPYTEYVEYVAGVVARALQEHIASQTAGEPRLNDGRFTQ
jgi:hypothetical protein